MADKKFVENIAEEIVGMISDTKKLVSLSQDVENIKVQQNEYFKNIGRLENRIKQLENRLENHIADFKTVAVEVERMITERSESLSKEQQDTITSLRVEIEELRRTVVELKQRSFERL